MRYVVFDIETQNIFSEVGSSDPTALDISIASFYDSLTGKYTSHTIEELGAVWPLLEQADAIIGYNSDHFDIPLLNKYYHGDLSHLKSIDLLKYIREGLGRRPKLDDVAEATLGEKKIAHGLKAVTWWKTGEIEKIKEYCEADVAITKRLYEYIRDNKHIKIKDFGGKTIEVPVKTDDWEADNHATLTQSLPF